jgi:hypothetical protein
VLCEADLHLCSSYQHMHLTFRIRTNPHRSDCIPATVYGLGFRTAKLRQHNGSSFDEYQIIHQKTKKLSMRVGRQMNCVLILLHSFKSTARVRALMLLYSYTPTTKEQSLHAVRCRQSMHVWTPHSLHAYVALQPLQLRIGNQVSKQKTLQGIVDII